MAMAATPPRPFDDLDRGGIDERDAVPQDVAVGARSSARAARMENFGTVPMPIRPDSCCR